MSRLDPLIKENLIKLLKEYVDIFAFLATNMVGLSPNVAEHHLNVDPEVMPVRQGRRHFRAELDRAIEEEVEKLFRGARNRDQIPRMTI